VTVEGERRQAAVAFRGDRVACGWSVVTSVLPVNVHVGRVTSKPLQNDLEHVGFGQAGDRKLGVGPGNGLRDPIIT